MLRIIILSLIFLISTSYAQGVVTTTTQGITVVNPSGSCPCPDSLDIFGRPCGLNSAYSRSGGIAPICPGYPTAATTTNVCPDLSNYNVPAGYRVAGLSPTCQAVLVPLN